MAYAIMRHGKINSKSKGVAMAHNHRTEGKDLDDEGKPTKEQKSNIDPELTRLNKYMFDNETSSGAAGASSMVKRIDAKLEQFPNRRKDAVEAYEVILSASPEFFDNINEDRAQLVKDKRFHAWVKDTVEWAKKEFGDNLVDIALHNDESSPHFHCVAVPINEKGRLCAKDVTSRKEMIRRQTDYAKEMERHGLERGLSASETHRGNKSLKEGRKELDRASRVKEMPEPTMPNKNMMGFYEKKDVEKLMLYAEKTHEDNTALLRERAVTNERVKRREADLNLIARAQDKETKRINVYAKRELEISQVLGVEPDKVGKLLAQEKAVRLEAAAAAKVIADDLAAKAKVVKDLADTQERYKAYEGGKEVTRSDRDGYQIHTEAKRVATEAAMPPEEREALEAAREAENERKRQEYARNVAAEARRQALEDEQDYGLSM